MYVKICSVASALMPRRHLTYQYSSCGEAGCQPSRPWMRVIKVGAVNLRKPRPNRSCTFARIRSIVSP